MNKLLFIIEKTKKHTTNKQYKYRRLVTNYQAFTQLPILHVHYTSLKVVHISYFLAFLFGDNQGMYL